LTHAAFTPLDGLEPLNGDIPYGDTSMTLEYLSAHFPQWKLVKQATNPSDPYQTVLFIRPV
jgi:hypothetical protein